MIYYFRIVLVLLIFFLAFFYQGFHPLYAAREPLILAVLCGTRQINGGAPEEEEEEGERVVADGRHGTLARLPPLDLIHTILHRAVVGLWHL